MLSDIACIYHHFFQALFGSACAVTGADGIVVTNFLRTNELCHK